MKLLSLSLLLAIFFSAAESFVIQSQTKLQSASSLKLAAADGDETKAAPLVSGEQLELMLQEWEQPLVVDAYATWCGPCLLMAPEFEAAAQDLKGKVRFVKLDTDKDEAMAARLNIMGLPTLLFLDKYEAAVVEEGADETGKEAGTAKAVLKGRIEGAMRKDNIKDLCEFHFFGGPEPKIF
jgi:thioredoxin